MKSASIAKLCMGKVARFANSIIIAVVDIGAIAISYSVMMLIVPYPQPIIII